MGMALITPTEFVVLCKSCMDLTLYESDEPWSLNPDITKASIDVSPQDIRPVDIAYIGDMVYMIGFFSDCIYKYDIKKMEYTGKYMCLDTVLPSEISIVNDMIVVIDEYANIFHYKLF